MRSFLPKRAAHLPCCCCWTPSSKASEDVAGASGVGEETRSTLSLPCQPMTSVVCNMLVCAIRTEARGKSISKEYPYGCRARRRWLDPSVEEVWLICRYLKRTGEDFFYIPSQRLDARRRALARGWMISRDRGLENQKQRVNTAPQKVGRESGLRNPPTEIDLGGAP